MRYVLLVTLFSIVVAYEKDMTFTVQAGKTDCFYQKVSANEVIDIEYQVIDATHGELDISFQLTDPLGKIVVADYKKPENSHRHTTTLEGDYRFCFDNSFSTFSQKTVFFDLMVENDESNVPDYDDSKVVDFGTSVETYMMRVRDISESLSRVRDNVSAARRLQELLSAHEARDRNLAEEMCSRVLVWSMFQICLMLLVGVTQMYKVNPPAPSTELDTTRNRRDVNKVWVDARGVNVTKDAISLIRTVFFVKSLFEDTKNGTRFKNFIPSFISQ